MASCEANSAHCLRWYICITWMLRSVECRAFESVDQADGQIASPAPSQPFGMSAPQRLALANSASLKIALSCALLGVIVLAGLVANDLTIGTQRRTVLAQSYMDPSQNPFAGSGKGGFTTDDSALYYGLNPDEPGRPGSYAWSTTTSPDTGNIVDGHDSSWIYQDGWKNPGGVLQGPAAYYYNELDQDENNQPQADVLNEQSGPDHTTTMPYSYLGSTGVDVGPQAVSMITSFDPYITDSNGVY